MKYSQRAKDVLKYASRRYFGYNPSLRKIKIDDDFLDQKCILSEMEVGIIFDVGANIGQTTQKYRKLFPRAVIYAFEPFPEVFRLYERNIYGDRLVHANQIALSDGIGNSTFFTNDCHYTNSLLPVNQEYSTENNYVPTSKMSVETDTLDNFCMTHGVSRINILKMDVQGGELLVLKGARKLLESRAIDLIYTEVEFTQIYKDQPLFDDLKILLRSYGYSLYETYNIVFSPQNKPLTADTIFTKDQS